MPGFLLLLLAFYLQPAADADQAWMKQAREWMLAQRMARENLSPERAAALDASMAKMSPEAIRVLVQVYEQTFGLRAPLPEDAQPADQAAATREWIVAYRILHDRLTPEQAKAYYLSLEKLSASQLRALEQAYQTKLAQEPPPSPGAASSGAPGAVQASSYYEDAAAQVREAKERMRFEEQKRGFALKHAQGYQAATSRSLSAANRSGNASARTETRKLENLEAFSTRSYLQQQSFSNRMYERSHYPGQFRYGRIW